MKKTLFCLITALSLTITGCWGGDDEVSPGSTEQETPGKVTYTNDDFSMQIPTDWEVIASDSFTSTVPAQTVVGFRNNIKNDVFTANVNIAKADISEQAGLDSQNYAKSVVAKAKKSLVNYQQISLEDYKISVNDTAVETFIAEFEGKKRASDPVVHFKQIYVVNGSTGYIITGAYLPTDNEDVAVNIEAMLKSFALN
ncbi:MAG: hypothetical protein AAB373_04130 [Patescibacteria group bacterium]